VCIVDGEEDRIINSTLKILLLSAN